MIWVKLFLKDAIQIGWGILIGWMIWG